MPSRTCGFGSKITRNSRYTVNEVRYLVENYERDTHRRRFNLLHAKLIDIDRALLLLRTLQPKAYLAVLLVGLVGIDQRTAGKLLKVDHRTTGRRYEHALTTMTHYLNTGRKT